MRIFIKAVLILALSGCVTGPKFSVDAISDHGKSKGSVVFIVAMNDGDALREKEFTSILARGLQRAGFSVTEDRQLADTVVMYHYREHTQTKTESRPVYTWIAPRSYNVNVTTQPSVGLNSYSTSGVVQESGIGHAAYVGQRSYSYDASTITLNICGFDRLDIDRLGEALKRKEPSAPPLAEKWRVEAANMSDHGGARSTFPLLVAASMQYLGGDTHGLIFTSLSRGEIASVYARRPSSK